MAQLISVRLVKSDHQPLGFRLQGGKDFGTPLVIQKVNGGSAAESAGLQAGDAVIRVNATDVYNLRHQEAQDAIRASGQSIELTVQRGGGTWRPSVTPTGSLPRPGKILGAVSPVTKTSLKASPQPSQAFGSGHNSVAKPFNYMNGSGDSTVKSIVNKQYNTPVGMYSDATIAETLSAQTEVLAGGVLGVNFKKNEKSYDAEKSAVFKMLQEDSNDPEPEVNQSPIAPPISGLRHVTAPVARPDAPINNTGGLPPGQNICEECERLIIGVFVRIKDKNLHVECFKCATCGSSLKNQGYYNLNGKLYCDIHAKLVARQNPPAPNLEPVTVPPGSKFPSGTYSAPLSAHTTPLPPLATTNYSNGGSSLFSPASNLSGPKPFGSSGSAYSPSLSPRSAPISPAARPLPTHQQHLAPAHAPAYVPAPAPTSENTTSSIKPEYKSAAEERLIKKMAKIALNGYEIGIQRKIKPGDHLQLMANKIQDTIVTKHPLNSGDSPDDERIGVKPILKNGQGSPERMTGQNAIKTPTFKNNNNCNEYERRVKLDENIHNIGDKIKDTIVNKHPSNKYSTNLANNFLENKANKFSNIGDKIKDTIVNKHPANMYSTNNDNHLHIQEDKLTFTNSDNDKHIYDKDIPSTKVDFQNHVNDSDVRAKFMTTVLSDASTEDNIKPEKINDKSLKSTNFMSSYNNGLLTNNTPKHFQQDSNVKATIMAIEKNDTLKEAAHQNSPNNTLKCSTNIKHKYSTLPKNTTSRNIETTSADTWKENTLEKPTQYNAGSQDLSNSINSSQHKTTHMTIPMTKGNDLYDNTLYTFKNSATNGTNRLQESEKSHSHNGGKRSDDDRSSSEDMKEESLKSETVTDSNTDSVVKMRNKKRDTVLDGGKRDSHIIARPISTMASLDCADGMYPVCHVDDKAITRGPFITALGRIWCPDHFICVNASCRRPLQDIGFVEENGQLYCEYCFEQFIAPACDKCHAKIKGDCLNAIGKHFHPECFNCVYCGKLFGNNPFFLEDGLPYCEADWNELFTTKCFACGFPVEAGDRWVEALNNNYHSQCFNCTMCKKNLEGQSFFAKGGRPFCKNHAR